MSWKQYSLPFKSEEIKNKYHSVFLFISSAKEGGQGMEEIRKKYTKTNYFLYSSILF